MAVESSAGAPPQAGRVFISYAREDRAFVQRLSDALVATGREVWMDVEDIPAGSDWRDSIGSAIAAASAVVVVLSPDYLASTVRAEELEQAERFAKRIIPVVYRDTGDPASVPPRIARLNWIFARDEDDLDGAINQLNAALDVDANWVHEHTRLLMRATEWDASGRDRQLLLRRRELDDAAAWLGSPAHEPAPTPLQIEYVVASLRASRKRGLADSLEEAHRQTAAASARRARFDINARMIADTPSADDVLGFAPLVAGLDALINDEKTTLPLAISVTAPWGAGKSSLMLQLRRRLEGSPPGARRRRRWFTVRFDAWKYERSERIWAALAKAIYDQTQLRMTRWERLRFRVRLERIRNGGVRYAVKIVGPALVILGSAVVALLPVVSSAAGASVVIGGLAAAAAVGGRVWGVVGDPFKRAIDGYVSRPRYEEQLGFTAEAEHDIASLTTALRCDEGAAGDSALAIFVDDLDRCSSRHVVEVVEAINQIFNSAEGRRCVFILGMDRDVVAASIDVAYRETLDFLAARGSSLGTSFGLEFLAKIVQLSVSIPEPDEPAMMNLFAQITGNAMNGAGADAGGAGSSSEAVSRFLSMLDEQRPANPVDVEDAAASIAETLSDDADRRALEEAERRQRAGLFTTDSADVAAAELEVLRRLGRNPRQIKRFDNAFRLQLHVANGTPGCRLTFDRDELVALAKWVGLRLLRPDLAVDLDAEPALARALEANANDGESEATAIRERYERWFGDPGVARILVDEERQRRISSLPLETFMNVV